VVGLDFAAHDVFFSITMTQQQQQHAEHHVTYIFVLVSVIYSFLFSTRGCGESALMRKDKLSCFALLHRNSFVQTKTHESIN
jgi:hypothetical protein